MGKANPPTKTIKIGDYRYPGELWSLVITFAVIALVFTLVILIFPSDMLSVIKAFAITLAGVSVYVLIVLIQQRAALGTLVRVSSRQFPGVYTLATNAAERLSMRPVAVYVLRSSEMNIYPLGLWRKPLIVVTSAMVDQLDDESMRFFLARELSHISAGHTWLRVLLKPLGADVAVVGKLVNSVIFGDWLNRSELTADRAGFIVCQSLTVAVSAMLKSAVGMNLFNQLDIEEFLGQITDVCDMSGRLTEVVAGQPFLTQRVRALTEFALSDRSERVMDEGHKQTRILESLPGSFVQPDASRTGAELPGWLLVSVADNKQFVLRKGHTRIGRDAGNDLVINNDRVSRFHAEITVQGKKFYLVDKGSSNGVWLNGKRINKPSRLKSGDQISFGRLEYHFVQEPDS